MKITNRLLNRIEKAPKVYLIVRYAHWTVKEFSWTGKWRINGMGRPCPEVYYWTDIEGMPDELVKIPVLLASTGQIIDWSFYEKSAREIAEALEDQDRILRGKTNG